MKRELLPHNALGCISQLPMHKEGSVLSFPRDAK